MKALGSFEVFSVKVTKEHHMVTIDEDGTIEVVLMDEEGNPKLNSEGKRMYIPGKHPRHCKEEPSRLDRMMGNSLELEYWNPKIFQYQTKKIQS